jgi:D-glucosaminate-specific PTS system IIB component
MSRVDARLVHGQVASRWIKLLHADCVVIVEDEVANDEFQVEMFNVVAPPGVTIECLTVDKAIEKWNDGTFGKGNTIILFKYPQTAVKAWKAGLKFDRLNVAQVPMATGRARVYNTVHLSPEEREMFTSFVQDDGVDVYIQAVPEDKQMPIVEAIKKMS